MGEGAGERLTSLTEQIHELVVEIRRESAQPNREAELLNALWKLVPLSERAASTIEELEKKRKGFFK